MVSGENIARQHCLVVGRVTLGGGGEGKGVKVKPRIRWFKLNKEEGCTEL